VGKRGWYHSSYNLNDSKNRSFCVHTPTIHEQSLAPNQHGIIEVQYVFPQRDMDVSNLKQYIQDWQQTMLIKLGEIFPGLLEHLEHLEIATPITIEKFTGNSQGAVYGWAHSPTQFLERRLGNTTEIENLFLVGHWTRPGGGTPSVAVSGWLLSDKILAAKLCKKIMVGLS